MPAAPEFPLNVYYDGACSICAREVAGYRSRDHNGRLVCIDISTPEFDPQETGIPLKDLMYELHAIDREGNVFRGVEAFWAIWQAFPSSTICGFLGTLIHLPVVQPIARLLYKGFARVRPYLPKRKDDCDSGACRLGKP